MQLVYRLLSDEVEGGILDRRFPAVAAFPFLGPDVGLHGGLPGALGDLGITGSKVGPGDVPVDERGLVGFVLGVEKAGGRIRVGGREGFAFPGLAVDCPMVMPNW